jgi:prepilin-type N-terminal cleavage/methylation domain-containing protein
LYPRPAARAGFTLLELLLTSLLSAVLLAGLWALFSTYMQLFETGQTKTEQSQLIRALAQQVADDLRSVVLKSRMPRAAARR